MFKFAYYTFAMTIIFRFPQNKPVKAVRGIFLFLIQRYKKNHITGNQIIRFVWANLRQSLIYGRKCNGLIFSALQRCLVPLVNAQFRGFLLEDASFWISAGSSVFATMFQLSCKREQSMIFVSILCRV